MYRLLGPDEAAVCGRTTAVKEAIEARFSKDCDDVTHSDLQSLGRQDILTISGNTVTSLQEGDFAGLTNLGILAITNTLLTTLPVNVFNGLSRLETLSLTHNNLLTSLPENIFQPFRRGVLLGIHLDNNQFGSGPGLPVNLFNGLRNLFRIRLRNNQLTSLPAGFFSRLNSLREVYLSGNNFPQAEQTRLQRVLGNKLFGGW